MHLKQAVARAAVLPLSDPRGVYLPPEGDKPGSLTAWGKGFWTRFEVTEPSLAVGFVVELVMVNKALKEHTPSLIDLGWDPTMQFVQKLVFDANYEGPKATVPINPLYARVPSFEPKWGGGLSHEMMEAVLKVSTRAAQKDQLRPSLQMVRLGSKLEAGDEAQMASLDLPFTFDPGILIPAEALQKLRVQKQQSCAVYVGDTEVCFETGGERRIIPTTTGWYPDTSQFSASWPENAPHFTMDAASLKSVLKTFATKKDRAVLRLLGTPEGLQISSMTANLQGTCPVDDPEATAGLDVIVSGERFFLAAKAWPGSEVRLGWYPGKSESPIRLSTVGFVEMLFPMVKV